MWFFQNCIVAREAEILAILGDNISFFHRFSSFFWIFWHFFATEKLMASACNRCQMSLSAYSKGGVKLESTFRSFYLTLSSWVHVKSSKHKTKNYFHDFPKQFNMISIIIWYNYSILLMTVWILQFKLDLMSLDKTIEGPWVFI